MSNTLSVRAGMCFRCRSLRLPRFWPSIRNAWLNRSLQNLSDQAKTFGCRRESLRK